MALIEGPHLLGEALAARIPLETVLATPAFLASAEGSRLAASLPEPPLIVAPELLDELCDADAPRGVLAVAHLPRAGAADLPLLADRPYLFLDGIQDPGNLGALARVAEAAGAAGMALAPGTVHPFHSRALRASAGSLFRLPVAVGAGAGELATHLAPLAPRWVALLPRGGEPLHEADFTGTLVLAVGAEGPGLSPAVQARADLEITIQLAPPVESLNATVAAALVLFEVRRRRGFVV